MPAPFAELRGIVADRRAGGEQSMQVLLLGYRRCEFVDSETGDALAAPLAGETLRDLDPHQIFRMLEAEVAFDAQVKRRAVGKPPDPYRSSGRRGSSAVKGVDEIEALRMGSAIVERLFQQAVTKA